MAPLGDKGNHSVAGEIDRQAALLTRALPDVVSVAGDTVDQFSRHE